MDNRFERLIEDLQKKLVDPTTIEFLEFKEKELKQFFRIKEKFNSAQEILDHPDKYHQLFKDDEWYPYISMYLAKLANESNMEKIIDLGKRFKDKGLTLVKDIILLQKSLYNHPSINDWFKRNYNLVIRYSQNNSEFEDDIRATLGMKPRKINNE